MDTETDRIVINVGGKRHETYASTLQTIPDTRLAWLAGSSIKGDNLKQEYFFDRNPKIFGIILNYYRTGQLHAPRDFCGPLFQEELAFWGIEEKEMEACCWPYYTQHRDAEKNLKDFVGPEFEDSDDGDDESSPDLDSSYGQVSCWTIYRPKIWAVLDDAHSSTRAKVFALVSLFMILASVASMCAWSVVKDKNNKYIQGFEYAFCVWFTLEFGARLLFCPDKIAFFKEMMTWVDFISLLPFYENIILGTGSLNFLRAVRLIRTFRALKVFAFTSGLQIIVQSLKASFRELILLLIILLIPVVVFSSILFEIETDKANQPDFQNIPEAFWWAIITMTTVGYGDMVPKTIPGRIIGGVCAIFGVLIVALPVSVIGNNFSTYYSHAQARLSLPKKKRRLICEAKLRMNNPRHGASPTSTTSLRQNGLHDLPEGLAQETREGSATKFRRYHRRSRNTLFAHGDVYIGPSNFDRNKIRRGNTCNEEENENESESETKSECLTTKETMSSGDLDNGSEKTAHHPPAPKTEELPIISALPRNFTLINSMHESEEIIEEDTRPSSVLSERRGTRKKKKSITVPTTRRKKSNSSLSKSWIELKTEHAPHENGRPQSSRGSKSRVSPADARGSYKNPAMESENAQTLSPSRIYSVPAFKVGVETTRLDKANIGNLSAEQNNEKNTNSSTRDNNRRTGITNEHDISNGFTA
ncbi:hypothetical protein ACROYT_G044463 [Oculina patagonica]